MNASNEVLLLARCGFYMAAQCENENDLLLMTESAHRRGYTLWTNVLAELTVFLKEISCAETTRHACTNLAGRENGLSDLLILKSNFQI